VDQAIAVERLVKHYGSLAAVDGISFSVPPGTIFGLLGRNGVGKTTTLECCIGIGRPTSGAIRVLGLDPTRPNDLALLRRQIGVQLQATSLPEKPNVREVLELYAEVERLRDAGKTIVLTTRYIEEAERLSDRICIIQRGKIVAEASPADLVAQHGGDATVSIVADGFNPGPALQELGTWTKAGPEWKLATRGEPGLALAAIVTEANAEGEKIVSLDMHRPTLEDAFIAITGETLAEGELG